MISYHTKRPQHFNSAAQRPAAVQPPSSSLQLYARVAAVVVGDYFDRSSTRLSPLPLAAAASAASVK